MVRRKENAYYQLYARREYFEEKMIELIHSKDMRDIKKYEDAIEKLDRIIEKFLHSQ